MGKEKSDKSWYFDHLLRLDQYSGRVTRIYNKYVEEFTKMAAGLAVDPGKIFSFDDFPQLKDNVSKAMAKIVSEVKIETDRATRAEWLEAAGKNDALVDRILLTSGLSRDQIEQFYNHNLDALDAFQSRKEKGIGLSDRIWRNTEQYKREIELGIDTAFGDGRPATTLSRDVRNYLKEPNKLFRRVRDKYGNLQLSKAAKAYNPGRGVYRSSYMNAKRLAVSEINMAYKASDQTRYEQLPIVLGYEIKKSKNHPNRDICDDLAGKYSKYFKFKGWHSFCRCYMVSILIDDEDRAILQRKILKGEDLSTFKPKGVVNGVPPGFDKWIKENGSRVNGWSNTPYWIRDNFKDGDLTKGLLITPPKVETPKVEIPKAEPPKPQPKAPLEPSKTIEEAEARMKQRFPDFEVNYKGLKKADAGIVDDITASLDYHFSQFPELSSKIHFMGTIKQQYEKLVNFHVDARITTSDWLIKAYGEERARKEVTSFVKSMSRVKSRSPRANVNSYAYSDPLTDGGVNGICWNEKFGIERISQTLKSDVASKWHPVKCDTAKSVIDHELGHKVDELLGLRSDGDFLKIYSEATGKGRFFIEENLSRYAWDGKNPKAEFIAEAWSEYLNSDNPRDIAKSIGELILRKYKEKFPGK